ncbi:MAG TPA: hypothetical protein VH186_33565 [Chloroflexia bacterium]|nr:hypothetical protein [Chloroflexia bacterium]
MVRSLRLRLYGGLWIALFLLVSLFSAFSSYVPVAQAAAPLASFPLGTDVTGIMDQLAGPDGDNLAADIARSNASWLRFEFKATDPTNLAWYDRAIGRLQSHGLQLMAVLLDPFATCGHDMADPDPDHFAEWVRTVYLKGCGVNGPGTVHQLGFNELTARYPYIQYWQIWNEPNVCGFFPADPNACGYGLWRKDGQGGEHVGLRWGMQKFGTLLATVYAERSNKNVKIVTGGILNAYNCSLEYDSICNQPGHLGPANCYALKPWQNYGCDAGVNLLMNSDAVLHFKQEYGRLPFDILGLHPYQPSAWANGYVAPAVYLPSDIERNVRRFVDSSYPIWFTEWSFDLASNVNQPPSCRYPAPALSSSGCEANVAALFESMVAGLNSRPDLNIGNVFWFNLRDQSKTLQTGLVDLNGRKRPVWYSFEAAAYGIGPGLQQNMRMEILSQLMRNSVRVLKSELQVG